jgi:hypothetical protein
MRKITLLVSMLWLVLNEASAQETSRRGGYNHTNYDNHYYAVDYREAEPIAFTERGITFYVFPTGEFDFDTNNYYGGQTSFIYKAKRGNLHTNRNTEVNRHAAPQGIRIDYDHIGRVRRVGNVFINYDYYNRVKRIGSVAMYYNSFALRSIGNMRLYYNHHGEIIWTTGFVNRYNYGSVYHPCPSHTCLENDFYAPDYSYDDEDFYFYKKDGTKEKMSKEDIETLKTDKKELASLRRKK